VAPSLLRVFSLFGVLMTKEEKIVIFIIFHRFCLVSNGLE
jgi:hypothetical protein